MNMTAPIKPLGDLVVAIREEAQQMTASGLYLPDNAKEKPIFAKVAAVGPEVKAVKVGDNILYKDYAITEVKVDNTDYLIVREEDILATL